MGIPIWQSPPTKATSKSTSTNISRCATGSPSIGSSEHIEWSAATTPPPRHVSSTTGRDDTTPRARARDPLVDENMLTLDEFLRETTAASGSGNNDAERHLQTLLLLHRRTPVADRHHPPPPPQRDSTAASRYNPPLIQRDSATADRSHASQLQRDTGSTDRYHPPLTQQDAAMADRYHPPHPQRDPAAFRRSGFDHTAAMRLRFTSSLFASAPDPAPAPAHVPSAPATAPAPAPPTEERPNIDSFDTLVSQIRRIGQLQDLMLSSVDNATATLEDIPAEAIRRGRSAVDSLRVREARLRAMQTRIDLLASEFALLRSTRRELRRVEQQANDIVPGWTSSEDPDSIPPPLVSSDEQRPRPRTIDRRTPALTESERELMLRNEVMQMQMESLSSSPNL